MSRVELIDLSIYVVCTLAAAALIIGLGGCACYRTESPALIVTDAQGQPQVVPNPDAGRRLCEPLPVGERTDTRIVPTPGETVRPRP